MREFDAIIIFFLSLISRSADVGEKSWKKRKKEKKRNASPAKRGVEDGLTIPRPGSSYSPECISLIKIP